MQGKNRPLWGPATVSVLSKVIFDFSANNTILSIRYQVSFARPVNYSEEASRLADMIDSYNLS